MQTNLPILITLLLCLSLLMKNFFLILCINRIKLVYWIKLIYYTEKSLWKTNSYKDHLFLAYNFCLLDQYEFSLWFLKINISHLELWKTTFQLFKQKVRGRTRKRFFPREDLEISFRSRKYIRLAGGRSAIVSFPEIGRMKDTLWSTEVFSRRGRKR